LLCGVLGNINKTEQCPCHRIPCQFLFPSSLRVLNLLPVNPGCWEAWSEREN
jgi:hypothetical protein